MSQRSVDDLNSFDDRTVVITGGASGIGLATARMVVDRGGRVILMGRSLGRLKAAQVELGAAAAIAELDVTDEDAVRRTFTGVERIDHLITAAAGTLRGRLIDLDTQRARELFEGKFWGQYHCVKYAASRMAADGSVVLFSGWISRKPAVEMSTLAAVDGAIEALARTLALELAPVRVNAISRLVRSIRRSGDRVSRRLRHGLISIALRMLIQWAALEPLMTSPKRSFSS